jgi:predicted unusual protein kinase regulating ubiquinone biosynthesis (AarF/ABC1/UbiB family)
MSRERRAGRRVAAVTAGIVGIAAAYLAVKEAGERRRRQRTGPVHVASRNARLAEMARLGASTAASTATHKAKRAVASADRRDELDAAHQLRSAEQVAEALGHMKGALMKLGQMASYLDGGLPEPVRDALSQLQSDAPPMSAELARATVEGSLGRPVEELYTEWDDEPIASASIGQVHRAVTPDGRAVAVKVQYPGVDEAIRADLDNAGLLFGAMGLLFPGMEPKPLVEELRARLTEELDYRLEARNQALFAEEYRDHPFIHIPAVVADRCADRVLTTELGDGARFDEVRSTWSQDERDLAGETIYRFVFRSLYRMHAFNGDPHPGNYLFHPGGRVTFLDFGLVKHFEGPEIDVLARMVESIVLDRDIAAYRQAIADAGFLPIDAPFTDRAIEEYFGHFYDFVRDDAPMTITPEWSSESVRRFFDASGPHGEIMKAANVPPDFVIIQRINLGLFAVLGELGATGNWRRIAEEIWPFVGAPPSTLLGEQDAAWARARAQASRGV